MTKLIHGRVSGKMIELTEEQRQAALDWLIDRKTHGRAQKPLLRILLRLGLYQLFWLDRIPNHAAVFETVKLAKDLGFRAQAGFVNALLRAYAREEKETRQLLEKSKRSEPALGYSHPKWLCERWQERWSLQELTDLLEWNNRPSPTYARMNTLKTDRTRLEDRWRKEAVEFDPLTRDWIPEDLMFQLESHPPLANLGTFEQGLCYIQDPSTLLSVQELDPKPGDQVLDLCAAPGGSTRGRPRGLGGGAVLQTLQGLPPVNNPRDTARERVVE
jgi:16S rRNA (cytosine967-C5)-methyltransferase